jgi:hypothetical protein
MDNTFNSSLEDNRLLEQMISKRTSKNTLIESATAKRERELNVLRNIKNKMGLAFPAESKAPSNRLTEDAPIIDFVNAVKTQSSSGSVNSEFEPTSLNWMPTTFEELKQLNPNKSAISDLKMVISGAVQQPGTSFAVVGPGDNRGTAFFVKASPSGSLFLATPNKNPKAFTNPGLNSDGDNDSEDDLGRTISPNPTPEAFMNILTVIKDKISCLEQDITSLKQSSLTERMDMTAQIEAMDDRSKSLINKLLSMAKEIREGGTSGQKAITNVTGNTVSTTSSKGSLTETTHDDLVETLVADVLNQMKGQPQRRIVGALPPPPNFGSGEDTDVDPAQERARADVAARGPKGGDTPPPSSPREAAGMPIARASEVLSLLTSLPRETGKSRSTGVQPLAANVTDSIINDLTDVLAENLLTGNVNMKLYTEAMEKYTKLVG